MIPQMLNRIKVWALWNPKKYINVHILCVYIYIYIHIHIHIYTYIYIYIYIYIYALVLFPTILLLLTKVYPG